MAFDILIKQEDNATILLLSGRLDVMAAREAENAFANADELDGDIILDLDGLEYIASAGLRAIKRLWKTAKGAGKSLTVRNADANIMEVFEITGFAAMLQFE